jgi:hypothetical protein
MAITLDIRVVPNDLTLPRDRSNPYTKHRSSVPEVKKYTTISPANKCAFSSRTAGWIFGYLPLPWLVAGACALVLLTMEYEGGDLFMMRWLRSAITGRYHQSNAPGQKTAAFL